MKMNVKKFAAMAESVLQEVVPAFTVKLVADPDDSATCFAYVFGVPDGSEREVKDRLYDVIEEKLDGGEFCVIPSVTNQSTTVAFYPQYLRDPSPTSAIPSNDVVSQFVAAASHRKSTLLLDFDDEEIDAMFNAAQCRSGIPVSESPNECQLTIAA